MNRLDVPTERPDFVTHAGPPEAITHKQLPALASRLQTPEREDPYSTSAAYYAMTGRVGLWLYGDEDSFMIISRHPNQPECLLFFPPFGRDPIGLLRQALGDSLLPPGMINIARLGVEDQSLAAHVSQLTGKAPSREALLDWIYPVHVLDTAQVTAHEGQSFRDFRNNVNRARRRGQWARPIDPSNDREAIRTVVNEWALRHEQSVYAFEDLVAPSMAAIALFEAGLPINGCLVLENAATVGFMIWEETSRQKRIANSLAGLSLSGNGTDEFATLMMCKTLSRRGFDRVCIGGSESSGLDAFKRKMNPVHSVHLQTIAGLIRG